MTLSSDPIKVLAAYRSGHRIEDVDGHCATDGLPVYRIKGGRMRHDQWEITKLTNRAAALAVERGWLEAPYLSERWDDGLGQAKAEQERAS